jgi:uncharacterized protein related to proFAR isomerase
MTLIPVLDLWRGQVVRAIRGNRRAYRPIASALCTGSDPLQVACRLCEYSAARRLYVADLDALLGGAPQWPVLHALLCALPGIELWLDAGFAEAALAQRLQRELGPAAKRVVAVYGSETLPNRAALECCFASPSARRRAVLSLDRRDGRLLDPAGCWAAPECWPKRVIVMTLERVGSNEGPDLQTMAELHARSPATRLIGAGGIRGEADLMRAHAAGASAWLVASALHDLRLPRQNG